MTKRVLIAAGGTGGHVIPGLTIAKALQEKGWQVTWLGTQQGLEAKLVPDAGITLRIIHVQGLRGKGVLRKLLAPFMVLSAIMQALRVLKQVKPQLVIGMGGYVSGPAGMASWLKRIPLIIHEQNTKPGLTNRILSRFAKRVCCAFPQTFPCSEKVIYTGNPVRADILNLFPPTSTHQHDGLRLLIIGGSQGAQALNQCIPQLMQKKTDDANWQVWHLTGQRDYAKILQAYQESGQSVRVDQFVAEMAEAYAWADLVICRAGALTVSELAVAGKASILIPHPFAVDDHQTTNAEFLVRARAAKLLPQSELTVMRLCQEIATLTQEPQTLIQMSTAARNVAETDATAKIVGQCLVVCSD